MTDDNENDRQDHTKKRRLFLLILSFYSMGAIGLTVLFFNYLNSSSDDVVTYLPNDKFGETIGKVFRNFQHSLGESLQKFIQYTLSAFFYSLILSLTLYFSVRRTKITLTLISPIALVALMLAMRFLIYSFPGMSANETSGLYYVMIISYVVSCFLWFSWLYKDVLRYDSE